MYYFKTETPPSTSFSWNFFSKDRQPSCSDISLFSQKTQTKPLVLFVNLLMKHGKKTHALRVLSRTLYLFKAKISKIKLEEKNNTKNKVHVYYKKKKTKQKNKIGFLSFVHTLPTSSANGKNFITLVSSKKGAIYYNFSGSSENIYRSYFTYFPFFSNKTNFWDFYLVKRFFHGKFLCLDNFKVDQKKQSKNRESFGYQTSCQHLLNLRFPIQKKILTKSKKKKELVAKSLNPSKKKLWYKNPVKKTSWDVLTVPQKNTFLYCLYKAISNVKPPLECRTKRIGGTNKQIPSSLSEGRQWGLAIRWIIEAAKIISKKRVEAYGKGFRPVVHLHENAGFPKVRKLKSTNKQKKEKPLQVSKAFLKENSEKAKFYRFCFCLAESLENAYYKRGSAMQKRNLCIETALTNRAFLRYRWW